MRYCTLLNYGTDQIYKIKFHSFPGFSTQGKFSVICAKYFETKYVSGRKLSYNTVPSLLPPHHPHQQLDQENGES